MLNHRQKTFAGSYAVTARLLFGSLLLSHLSALGVRFFGRPQLMTPFTFWDVITLVISAIYTLQASIFPPVDQVSDEPSD